jgi:hypothetical protein
MTPGYAFWLIVVMGVCVIITLGILLSIKGFFKGE